VTATNADLSQLLKGPCLEKSDRFTAHSDLLSRGERFAYASGLEILVSLQNGEDSGQNNCARLRLGHCE
jgi:hypothetical protein